MSLSADGAATSFRISGIARARAEVPLSRAGGRAPAGRGQHRPCAGRAGPRPFATGLGAGSRLLALGAGFLALFVGVALVAPRLVRPLAGALGAPGHRFAGAAAKLARRNAARHPGRTASTAAALMVGLALVTVVAALGQGLRHSITGALSEQVTADYIVTPENGLRRFSEHAGQGLPPVPSVRGASAVLGDRAKALGKEVSVAGVDPATIDHTYRFR